MKIYKYVNLQTYRYKNTVQKIRTHTMPVWKSFVTGRQRFLNPGATQEVDKVPAKWVGEPD